MGRHVGLEPKSLVYTGSSQAGFGWLTPSTPGPGALGHTLDSPGAQQFRAPRSWISPGAQQFRAPGPWIFPDAHPSAPPSRAPAPPVALRGWLPGSLSLTALPGAEPAYPSLDVQLVLELPVGPCLSCPGLFPLDEAVGRVALDADIVGWVVLLCNETPGGTSDAECLPWSTEGRPLSPIPTRRGAPEFTGRRAQVQKLQ